MKNKNLLFIFDDQKFGTYYAAVVENCTDFVGRMVVDVGAGSSILILSQLHPLFFSASLFVLYQAGAKHVYVVEASEMAEYARKLTAGNPLLAQRIMVVKGKVEEVELPEKADILISGPMELDKFEAPKRFSMPRFQIYDGKSDPNFHVGLIHMTPFSDEYLYVEIANKALFWQQRNYYEVDLTPLYGSAFQGYFSHGGCFDPSLLVAPAISHMINFTSIKRSCMKLMFH
ncbi:hypothetical protein CsSME_00033180 [Camellia sinensis var. sinensis]